MQICIPLVVIPGNPVHARCFVIFDGRFIILQNAVYFIVGEYPTGLSTLPRRTSASAVCRLIKRASRSVAVGIVQRKRTTV